MSGETEGRARETLRLLARAGLRIPAHGVSMWPYVREGDVLAIRFAEGLRVGDVAVVLMGGRLVAHRVRRIDPEHVLLRGDTCRWDDPLVPREDVVGRVESIERGGRVRTTDSTLDRVYARIATRLAGAPALALSIAGRVEGRVRRTLARRKTTGVERLAPDAARSLLALPDDRNGTVLLTRTPAGEAAEAWLVLPAPGAFARARPLVGPPSPSPALLAELRRLAIEQGALGLLLEAPAPATPPRL